MTKENFQLDYLEKILSLGQEIKKAQEHLDSLVEEWNATYSKLPMSGDIKKASPSLPAQIPIGSIDDRIISYLDEHSDQAFSVNMLFDKLHVGPASLGTQLSKLYNSKKIARVGRGLYQSLKQQGVTEVTP